MLKTLTLQEANGLLPLLREHRFRMNALLIHLQKLRQHFDLKFKRCLTISRKGSRIILVEKKSRSKKQKGLLQEIQEIEDLIGNEVTALLRYGAVVKNLYPLHIDFLSIRNHEPVFLCWHGEEDEIKHWHHLDDAAPFRQIIECKRDLGTPVVH